MINNNKYKGCLLGLAIGDALGTTLEFRPPGTFEPISDIVGGGPFRLKVGEWTDDTSMALCLAESLIEKEEFDPIDQLERYIRWKNEGYMSSNGTCFDIGNTVSSALDTFSLSPKKYPGPDDEWSAGNGSLMRLAPIPMFYLEDPVKAIHYAGLSSKTTHGNRQAIDSCRYYAGLIVGALQGESKETILEKKYCPVSGFWGDNPIHNRVDEVASGSFKEKDPPEIVGSGYVIKSMESALWAFYNSDSFEEGCLMAVNLGDDADTTGAIFGQLAGAFYGFDQIPDHWIKKIVKCDLIMELTHKLFECRYQK